MNADPCRREDELLDALGRGFIGPELAAHIEACPSCKEIHMVAGAVLDERVQAVAEAPIPSSGTMLFRMKLRQHQEAQATARRSLLIGQAATLTIAILLVAAFFGADLAVEVREVIATIRVSTPLLLAVAMSIVLAPIAGWVVVRQK